jgi:hypothetical protein
MINVGKLIIFSLFLITSSSFLFGQSNKENTNFEKNWFIGLDLGIQMSGIKSEDFITSNYSPLIRVVGGKWFNPNFGFQAGYQGKYFNAIADNDKHFYNFYFFEGVLDVKNILSFKRKENRLYELLFHAGVGLFQNRYYGNSSVHGVLGAANNFSLSKKIKLKFDIGAIVGWDIYQGDDDILPSLSMGVVYLF